MARRLAPLGAVALLLGALLFALFRAGSVGQLGEVRIGASKWLMTDFRTVVYYPAKAFADGLNPYDTDTYKARYPAPLPFRGYPPAVLALTRPMAELSLGQAVAVSVGLTIGLSAVLAWVSLRLSGVRPTFTAVTALWGILLLSRPGHWNLLLGQFTLVMVLAVYAVLALPKRRAGWAGTALAVTMLKPTFGIPLGVLMVVLGRWRPLFIGAAITAVLNLGVLAILAGRSGGYVEAVSLILPHGDRVDASVLMSHVGAFRLDALAMVSRFAGQGLGVILPFLIAGGLLGLTAYALRRRLGPAPDGPLDATSAGLACTGILICVYHVGYDSLLLAWPATALAVTAWRARAASVRERIQLALLLLLAVNYLSTYSVLEAVGFDSPLALPIISLNSLALAGLFATYARAALEPPMTHATISGSA